MALVVTARSPLETRPGLSDPTAPPRAQPGRAWHALRWLASVGAVWYGLAFVVDMSARFGLEAAALPMDIVAGGLVAAVCVGTWVAGRHDAGLLLSATLAAVLVALRLVAVETLQMLELPLFAAVADGALGMLVLGLLVWTAATAAVGPAHPGTRSAETGFLTHVVDATALLILGVGLTGLTVRAVGASWACQGTVPDCNGLGVLPFGRDPLADIQLYHRLMASVALALVAWIAIEAYRTQRYLRGVGGGALVLLGASLAEGGLGALSVSLGNPAWIQALHAAGSAAAWSTAVLLAVLLRRSPIVQPRTTTQTHERVNARTIVAYVQLTKPRVMSLLLATTATAMVIAARGLPDLRILFATLIGGALMSGGAGAINHYVDRDIDPLMGRTAWRPIPSGVISPRRALWFGIALAVLASAIFVVLVNVLACVLALLGLLGYVFIYTLWLKRSTPSNIVIGGAAGAIPPLVGWAAVTNEIGSLTAWYLFAIIFFWTPPHFWALSLLIRKHYERAGVPMLPVVRGEDETRRQIVLYSVLLVVLTLVLSPFGMMGGIYFVAAFLLGGFFVGGAIRLWRQATAPAARSLYLYSIAYLFALFTAMAVDRVVVKS